MEVRNETFWLGIEGWETLKLCSGTKKEAGQELAVVRTTFSDSPIFPDPSQRVGGHRGFLKPFCWGVSLGT